MVTFTVLLELLTELDVLPRVTTTTLTVSLVTLVTVAMLVGILVEASCTSASASMIRSTSGKLTDPFPVMGTILLFSRNPLPFGLGNSPSAI